MEEKVYRILSELSGKPAQEMHTETRLGGDLNLSSLDLINALVLLEEEFHISIDDRSLPDIQTIGDVFELIRENDGGGIQSAE